MMKLFCSNCFYEKEISQEQSAKYAGRNIKCPQCNMKMEGIERAKPVEPKQTTIPTVPAAKKAEAAAASKLADEISFIAKLIVFVRNFSIILTLLGGIQFATNGDAAGLFLYILAALMYSIIVYAVAGFSVSVLKYMAFRLNHPGQS